MSQTELQNLSSSSENQNPTYQILLSTIGETIGCFTTYICCCWPPYKIVNEGYKGVIQKFGKIKEIVDPGLYYVNPLTEKMTTITTKTMTIQLNKQTVISKDNLNLIIDAVLYYKIIDINQAIYKINDIDTAVCKLAHATLRTVIGQKTLQECLEQRKELSSDIQNNIAQYIKDWGIDIISIQLQDIQLPEDISNAISSTAIAKRNGEALIITAKSNVDSAKLMKESAELLSSPSAMQIRYLQTLEQLGKSHNAKLIFIPPHSQITDLVNYTNIEKL